MADYNQTRFQHVEDHLKSLDEKVSVLSAVNDAPARQRIRETFGDNPRMAIIYRGVQRRLTQKQVAAALKARGLAGPHQSLVSLALNELEEKGFVKKAPAGGYSPVGGWSDFGLEKVLKKALKSQNIEDLA